MRSGVIGKGRVYVLLPYFLSVFVLGLKVCIILFLGLSVSLSVSASLSLSLIGWMLQFLNLSYVAKSLFYFG